MNPFYSRLEPTSLETTFFPVELCPLYWEGEALEKKPKGIFETYNFNLCPNHLAVVNMQNGYVFACVTKGYALITNKEAYQEIGNYVAMQIFGREESFFFQATNVYMSKTKGECIIDYARYIENNQPLINNGWQAFIRMENSYNNTRKLAYTIGFKNIHEDATLSFKTLSISIGTAHTGNIYSALDRQFRRMNTFKIDEIELNFQKKINTLKYLPVAKEDIFPLFCKIFGIHKPSKEVDEDKKAVFLSCYHFIEQKAEESVSKYGKNAYSLLLVFAGYANATNMANLNIYYDKAQASLGSWVDEYIEKASKPGFSISQFIGHKASDTASWIRSL